jgi:hypothetical protein
VVYCIGPVKRRWTMSAMRSFRLYDSDGNEVIPEIETLTFNGFLRRVDKLMGGMLDVEVKNASGEMVADELLKRLGALVTVVLIDMVKDSEDRQQRLDKFYSDTCNWLEEHKVPH